MLLLHLVVGHVDELVTFLPAPDTPLGYVVLMADPILGWEMLAGVDPTENLSKLARAALEPSRWRPQIRIQDEAIARAVFDALENLLAGRSHTASDAALPAGLTGFGTARP